MSKTNTKSLTNKNNSLMKTSVWSRLLMTGIVMSGAVFLMSSALKKVQQATPWVAPAAADTIKNPLKGNVKSVEDGKKLYAQNCVVCHGDKGKGDGIAAAGLNPKPADHTSEKIQKQTDGAIFWKMTTGRSPMASYATTFNPAQRWALVNYIRALRKEPITTSAKTK